MALSDLSLCSQALLKLGAMTISSFTEGTAEAEVAAHLYPSLRDAMLSSHPWHFAVAQTTLPKLLAVPVADYAYAFQLPAGFLRVISAGVSPRGRGIDYRIVEDRLHANVESVVLTYIFRPDETAFPAFFDQALIARLAAEFCLPLTESTSRAELLVKLADQALQQARLIDSQQDVPERITDFPLIDVRG